MRKLLLLMLLLPGCLPQPRGQAASLIDAADAVQDLAAEDAASDAAVEVASAIDAGSDAAVEVAGETDAGSDVAIADASEVPQVLGISVNGVGVPGFAAGKSTYTLKVSLGTQTASVTVDAAEGVTLTVNGQALQAGQPSPPTALDLGANVFTVTASAAGKSQVYTLTVTRGLAGQEAYVKASNTDAFDDFGHDVAIDGDTLVVGALAEDSEATGINGNQGSNAKENSGAAYVFVRSGSVWSQQAYLKAANTDMGDLFGSTVAIAGDTVVVGASYEGSKATGIGGDQGDNSAPESGAAYVFVRNGTTWSQQAYLKAANANAGDHFGSSVAIDGDTVVVGASGTYSMATGIDGNQGDNSKEDSGAAYVFVRTGTVWSQQAYFKASNTDAGDAFGQSVAIAGDTVVVGAWNEDSKATGVDGNQGDNSAPDSGAAYVFVRHGQVWNQQAYLKASNAAAGCLFGVSVGIAGDTVVVGAHWEDGSAVGVDGNQGDNLVPDSGAAYVFVRSGTTWSQQAYLKASNAAAGDWFGGAVAIAGDTVVVGAWREDGQATGIDGELGAGLAPDSGAAYVFVRSGTTWSQQAYLKASNTTANDWFGWSVGIAGDTVVIGAPLEDSKATGIGGDQGDKSAGNSGAVYIFR